MFLAQPVYQLVRLVLTDYATRQRIFLAQPVYQLVRLVLTDYATRQRIFLAQLTGQCLPTNTHGQGFVDYTLAMQIKRRLDLFVQVQ